MGLSEISQGTEPLCWYICFAAGLLLFLTGIFYLIRKKDISSGHVAIASAFEFTASVILFLPEEFFHDVPASMPGLHVFESLSTAILRTFNIYLGNDYSRVTFEGHPVFSGFYATLLTLINLMLLLCAARIIIDFLQGPLQKLRLSFQKKKRTFLFPACNEKTLAIAESIGASECSLIFCCSPGDLPEEYKERLNAMAAIYVDKSIEELFPGLYKKSSSLEVFLFDDEETTNLTSLDRICDLLPENIASGKNVRIFVELSQTPWSLYDGFLESRNAADGKGLVINFVRTEENFAYNNLWKHSIFENAVPAEENGETIRRIGFLLVGMNERSLEMFKAVLHLSQMPGYRLTLMVLDKPDSWRDHWEEILQKIPEIHKDSLEGDALYKIHYFDSVNFRDSRMEDYVEEYLPDYNFAFVNTGDDLLNLNLALRLQALRHRSKRSDGYQLQVSIRDPEICRHWNQEYLEHLQVVGSTRDTYDYRFITMSDIEKASIAIHEERYPKDPFGVRVKSWISYCNREYNRHSVYARTLSFKYKVKIIDEFYGGDYSITSTDRVWKVYEHMRWNVYTRTMGYVLADSSLLDADGSLSDSTRRIARVHNDLVPYEELSREEQDKDALKLTPKIVEILKSI